MRSLLFIPSGLLLVIITGVLSAQTISQEEFLEQLQRAHPLFEKERLTAEIGREDRNSFGGAEDWHIRSQVGFSHEEPALSFAGPDRTNTLSASVGLERTLWSTGGRLSASYTSSSASILPTFGFTMPFYQNMIAVSYVQPILKNSGGTLDRLAYDLKQFDIDASDVQAAENIEAFLAQSAKLFLGWVFLTEQEKILAERLRLSEEERDRTLEKRKANLVDQADVMRAEDAVRSWKQALALLRSQWKAVQAQLAVLTNNGDFYSLTPEYDLYSVGSLPALDDALTRLKSSSRVLRIVSARVQQQQLSRQGFEEALRPELSAYASVNTKRLDEGLGKSFLMDKPDAHIGLQFSIPLGNTTARAKIASAEIRISQLEKQAQDITLSLSSELTHLHIRLVELGQILALNREQIQSAQERTSEELKLYNQGRGELTFVILSRDNEQQAKLTYAQNAFSYHSLRLEYAALMDEIYESEVK